MVNDPNVLPSAKDLDSVYDLMCTASEIYESNYDYSKDLCRSLGDILDVHIDRERSPDNDKHDGVIMMEFEEFDIPYAFIDLEREVGEGGCDPTSQVSLI
jgi:hypothetical protein